MLTTKEKMLKVLKASRGRVAFTTKQARRRFGIVGVRQRIHELRGEGYTIETVTRTVRGRDVAGYRLMRNA